MGLDVIPMTNQYLWTLIHLNSHEFTAPIPIWTRAASKKKGDASIAETEDIWHTTVPEKRSHNQKTTHNPRRNFLTNLRRARAPRSLAL
jgi:hypothetical protein